MKKSKYHAIILALVTATSLSACQSLSVDSNTGGDQTQATQTTPTGEGASQATAAETQPGDQAPEKEGPEPTQPVETSPEATTAAGTSSTNSPETDSPKTEPASRAEREPATKVEAETKPATQAETKAETKPVTQAETKPETKPSTGLTGINNNREEWSYGYPDAGVKKYGGRWKYHTNLLYITMDLGYEMGYTKQILNTLGEKGVKATFFVTTEYIKENPDLVRAMIKKGHKVGNHSTGHINMVKLVGDSGADLRKNTQAWEKAYEEATGRRSSLYRAPEGVYSDRGMQVLQDMGYKTIFWAGAYDDWDENDTRGVEYSKKRIYPYCKPGNVLLLHPFRINADFLPVLIDEMHSRGFSFGLIPE